MRIFTKKYEKQSFLFGIDTTRLLTAAIEAGYSYMAGPVISPVLERPRHAWFLKMEDLYQGPPGMGKHDPHDSCIQ